MSFSITYAIGFPTLKDFVSLTHGSKVESGEAQEVDKAIKA